MGGRNGSLVWDLRRAQPGSEINAISRIDEGALLNLSSAEWFERWREFRARHPNYHRLSWSAEARVRHHQNRAAEAAARDQRDTEGWHRARLAELGQ